MNHLLNRMLLFHLNIEAGKLEAAQASKRLIDKAAVNLELKVWRYASRLIMHPESEGL
jgi:hypothetical protein